MRKFAITILAAVLLAPVMAMAQFSTPVRDVENPARTPFSLYYTCSDQSCSSSQSIPAGMRFVIETVSGYLRPGSDYSEPTIEVEGSIGSTYSLLYVPALRGGLMNGELQTLAYCSAVKLYTDSVPRVQLPGGSVDNSYSNSARAVSLIGHLVKK